MISADVKNFESTLSKMIKGKKKPKQNSRAQENCFWQASRLDTQFTFTIIMKHSGLLIPTQLHKQLANQSTEADIAF